MSRRSIAVLGVVAAALAAAAGALALAAVRHEPAQSLAGAARAAQIGELVAGWGLVAAGLAHWARYRRTRFSLLVVAAGIAWFATEWANPGIASSLAFTAGLVGATACVPLLAHAALVYPDRRLAARLERSAVALAYGGGVVALGLLPAIVFDPRADGCFECPRNLLRLHSDTELYSALLRWGLRFGLVWSLVSLVALARRATVARAARGVVLPVLIPAALYIALQAVAFGHSARNGFVSTADFDRRIWSYQEAALTLLAAAVIWGLVRARRARDTVAQWVVELSRSGGIASVRDALARALDDPSLELAYLRDGRPSIDAAGRTVDARGGNGRAVTSILREGVPLAVLVHDEKLLSDPDRVQEALATARLAINNEQFRATVRGQVDDIRSSQERIIERGDAERRRLERDLHDGAQQRMLGLSMALQLLRGRATPEFAQQLDDAQLQLQAAHAELREIAHGIYPAMLSAEGLSAAVETLAERGTVAIRGLPRERFAAPVEAAAYFAVAEAVRNGPTIVDLRRSGDVLVGRLDVECAGSDWVVEVADRVGALGGRVEVEDDAGAIVLRVEIPCG